MPVHSLCFRAKCGSFVSTFHGFMSERAKLARQLRYRMIKVRSKLDTLLFLSVAFYLISIGCGELGPVMRCSDGVACDFLIGRPLQHDPDSIGSDRTSYPDSFSINTFLLRCGDIESNPGPFATSATIGTRCASVRKQNGQAV